MTKAILVIDLDDKLDLKNELLDLDYRIANKDNTYYCRFRDVNVPLKELPKKKNIEDISLLNENSDLYDYIKAFGFNECLDEILGEENE